MPEGREDPSTTPAPPKKSAFSNPVVRIVLFAIGAAILIGAVLFGIEWWTVGRFIEDTNDAYLRADQVNVAPKVEGYVDQVLVTDNQDVAAGQPLVRIDATSYQASLAQQRANVDARKADIEAAARQIAQQQAVVEQMQAQLSGAQATAAYAGNEAMRYRVLSAQGVETLERAAQAKNQQDQAQATAKADAAALLQAQRQVETLKAQAGQAKAQLQAAQAQLDNAQINVGDTLIRSSIAGRGGDRSVRAGQFVQPGTRLMSVVPVADIYLVANFKETQIGGMRIGQPAKIRVDALSGRKLDGVVESFSPGTGSQFALLPPENATGNFTKIVQRVPVRIKVIVPDDLRGRLVPGLSVVVEVDTRKPERPS